jgi:hypothetical protein
LDGTALCHQSDFLDSDVANKSNLKTSLNQRGKTGKKSRKHAPLQNRLQHCSGKRQMGYLKALIAMDSKEL